MDEAELTRIREQFAQQVRDRFPAEAIERIEVLQHGDDLEVEPGQLLARVVIHAAGDHEERERAFEAVHDQHREAFRQLRQELDKLPVPIVLQFAAGGEQAAGAFRGPVIQLMRRHVGANGPGTVSGACDGPTLTPVMARLGAEDLETLDTLIAAGIASSRAEAVRWTLARIRERPAYAQLRTHAQQIEDLKSQF